MIKIKRVSWADHAVHVGKLQMHINILSGNLTEKINWRNWDRIERQY